MKDTRDVAPLLAKLKPTDQTQLFLENYQQGCMDVVVIDQRGFIVTKPYTSDLAKKHPQAGLYYTLNEVDEDFAGVKPAKTDITRLRGWGADIDPDSDNERDPDELLFKRYHISAALKHKNPKVVRELAYLLQEIVHPIMEGRRGLPPSLLIFSGRGIQLIWHADKDYKSSPERIEKWEGLGRAIIATVGGDAVQNVDRLLRLPGTPNKKTGLLSRIMWENDVAYSPKQIRSAFGEAPVSVEDNRQGVDPTEFKYVDWDLVFGTTDLLDLDDSLIERFTKDLTLNNDLEALYTGHSLPSMRDTSGSSFDLSLVGMLKRKGYDVQDALQIMMTYDAGSGHKHADKRNTRHFMRCWSRTMESSPQEDFKGIPDEEVDTDAELTHRGGETADKDIRKNYMFIASANRIIHIESGEYFDLRGFDTKFCITHTGKPDELPKATKTLIAAGRQADKVTWMPGQEKIFRKNGLNLVNMYRPNPMPVVTRTPGDVDIFYRVLNHVIPLNVAAEYFMDWCAFTVQFPGIKINHHPLMFSEMEGVGKDTIIDPVRWAIGAANSSESALKDLTGSFNEALKYKKLIIINEVESFKQGKEAINVLKPLLAAPPESIKINAKFEPLFDQPNIFSLIMTSNSKRPIYVAIVDRRLVIIHCVEQRMPEDMGQEIWDWLKEGGGRELMFHELMTRDISNFNPNVRPNDAELLRDHSNMVEDSKSSTEMMVGELVDSHQAIFSRDILLSTDLLEFMAEKHISSLPVLQNAIGVAGGVQLRRKSVKHSDGISRKHTFWVIRNHEKYLQKNARGDDTKLDEMSYGEMYAIASGITDFDGV